MRIRENRVLVGMYLSDARLWQRRGRSHHNAVTCRMMTLIEGRE